MSWRRRSTTPLATRNGNETETTGYTTAKDRVTVSATAGAGSFTIR